MTKYRAAVEALRQTCLLPPDNVSGYTEETKLPFKLLQFLWDHVEDDELHDRLGYYKDSSKGRPAG